MAESWETRLNNAAPHEVVPASADRGGMKKGQLMLLPTPRLVDAYLRSLPRGAGSDLQEMRAALAAQYGAEVTCPARARVSLRIAAEAGWEAHVAGTELARIAPFWRVLDAGSAIGRRLACGPGFIAAQRRAEGLPE